jgi:hypothetical protein
LTSWGENLASAGHPVNGALHSSPGFCGALIAFVFGVRTPYVQRGAAVSYGNCKVEVWSEPLLNPPLVHTGWAKPDAAAIPA